MKIQEIQDLIKLVSRTGVTEVEIEQKDFKLSIKSEGKKKSSKLGEGETTVIQAQLPIGISQMPTLQMPVQAAPILAAAPGNSVETETKTETAVDSNYVTIKSPMIGTFYRSSAPDQDPYLNIGDSIKPGKVICIVEAMKLFNEIEAEISGTIVKVLADDSSPVEFDQPLFLVDPL